MTDEERYSETLFKKYQEHEALCNRCGACCGMLDGDPCEHLEKTPDGLYACDIYEQRFGLRKTIKGEPVLCVPIHNVLHKTWWGRARCAYIRRV
ncbi:MAG: hypothetical protein KKD90_03040 [Candidatus Omnitrophica bacterium]|nr:hypothetical protein [Candidatus Omnitrophota bacterium]MBU4149374.1 hypothetical protein [Candidatus Omnitrophota bacterium]